MTNEYIPTTEEVRNRYLSEVFPEDEAEFDRWLTEYTRIKQAEALEEAAAAMRVAKQPGHWHLMVDGSDDAAYSPDLWLEVRATRHRSGGRDA